MTKDQIKSLISAKIAGQGNQVDSGGALDEILNAIVDAIPEGGGVIPITLDYDPRHGIRLTDQSAIEANFRDNGCNIVLIPDGTITLFEASDYIGYLGVEEDNNIIISPFEEAEEA